jgi:hypothetical protein
MSAWYEHGYFSDDLEIALGENSMFFPLKSYKFNSSNLGSTSSATPKYSQEYNNFPQFNGLHL